MAFAYESHTWAGHGVQQRAPQPPAAYTSLRVSGDGENAHASLESAIAAALELRRKNTQAAIRIEVADGDYFLAAPVRIGPELSGSQGAPTMIVAASGARPRLLSGHPLRLRWLPHSKGILKAKLEPATAGQPLFDQFFVNGIRQIRARYPDYDARAAMLNGYAADAIAPERVRRWKTPAGAIVHAIHERRWGGMHIPVLGKNEDRTLRLGTAVGNNRPSLPHPEFRFVENVMEELDAPGEWYADAGTSMIYFKPPRDLDVGRARFAVSGPPRLVDLQGSPAEPVRFVWIEGLTFMRTAHSFLRATEPLLRSDWMIAREGALFLEHTEHVTITGNEFAELGGNAVFVSGNNRNVAVSNNHIHHIGGGGINFTGRSQAVRSPSFRYEEYVPFRELDLTQGPKSEDYPRDSSAHNNLIHDIGSAEKQVAGVQISMAQNIHVSHNTIYTTPRAGINIGDGTWGGHLIEWNDVFDTVLETGDHGAFNSWGRDRFWHPDRATMDQINHEHPGLWKLDALKPVVIRRNRFRCDRGWDIDLDDGSSHYQIYENLLLSGGLKFREGFQRAAWNNVLVNNGFHPHVWFQDSGDRFERNIVMAPHQPILVEHWDATIDYNFFPTRSALEQSRALGLDAHSLAGDPAFINAAAGDFRVADGSPVIKIGFRNFSMDGFGVTNPKLQRLARQVEIPPLVTLRVSDAASRHTFLGAIVKGVTSTGEQSALGLAEAKGVLVLDVPRDSLAAYSGLEPSDVILRAPADDFGPVQPIDGVATLMQLYFARRWRGQQDVIVLRDQAETQITLRFAKE
ncbi:MAG: right-handed parallel beta-helix repeat-containing protein [Gammaproteobacteria bacterium]